MRASTWPLRTLSPAFTASASTLPPTCAATVAWRTGSTVPSRSSARPLPPGCTSTVATSGPATAGAAWAPVAISTNAASVAAVATKGTE